jgi:hypothetical protein
MPPIATQDLRRSLHHSMIGGAGVVTVLVLGEEERHRRPRNGAGLAAVMARSREALQVTPI